MADEVTSWWQTEIIDIHPNIIRIRGYAIEDLIGNVGFVDQIWLMLRGERPSRVQARLLEAALVAAVDHGPQAPSIATARMAMTCGVGLNNAVASGVNLLGSIHGGAGEQALEFYEGIRAAMASGVSIDSAVAEAVDARLAVKRPIEGFGHRFHRKVDPRTPRLLKLLDEARAQGAIGGDYCAIGRTVEKRLLAVKRRPLPMNIDGITACLYGELGFPPPLARGLFILSRSVGILAHAWEQSRQGGRIKGPLPPSSPYAYTGHGPRKLTGPREEA
ncbi:citryl-CoA lyase [Mesorhizobium australicum]|uniref:citrate synthase (unknown stereospecificity) n=1 Tax=Mesorhizobium australicum TaxID=536018 RepID=A0A1X7MUX6_9HYPH|nr:citryl-CoA lyase [Mesorhizobium australicum]SMH27753.1 citrate synthase [Mesorhizobium australicum]